MVRKLFTPASALSLVLCAAAAVLWVRSYSTADVISRCWPAVEDGPAWLEGRYFSSLVLLQLQSYRGAIEVIYVRPSTGPIPRPADYVVIGPRVQHAAFRWTELTASGAGPPFRNVRSFWTAYPFYVTPMDQRFRSGPFMRADAVVVPNFCIVAVAAVLPLLWLGRGLVRHFVRRGHCAICGYDLRATPDRCPECGTAVPTSQEAIA